MPVSHVSAAGMQFHPQRSWFGFYPRHLLSPSANPWGQGHAVPVGSRAALPWELFTGSSHDREFLHERAVKTAGSRFGSFPSTQTRLWDALTAKAPTRNTEVQILLLEAVR